METAHNKPVLVVLSGAGISRESGIKTFRDGDGLWEDHDVMEVATPQAWSRDPDLVLRFYNARQSHSLEEVIMVKNVQRPSFHTTPACHLFLRLR